MVLLLVFLWFVVYMNIASSILTNKVHGKGVCVFYCLDKRIKRQDIILPETTAMIMLGCIRQQMLKHCGTTPDCISLATSEVRRFHSKYTTTNQKHAGNMGMNSVNLNVIQMKNQ